MTRRAAVVVERAAPTFGLLDMPKQRGHLADETMKRLRRLHPPPSQMVDAAFFASNHPGTAIILNVRRLKLCISGCAWDDLTRQQSDSTNQQASSTRNGPERSFSRFWFQSDWTTVWRPSA
jgi:hypothetical protein